MKSGKIIVIWAVWTMVALTVTAGAATIPQQACTYSISPLNNILDPQTASGSVAVTADPNCSWTASTDPGSWDWIGISSGTSGAGNGTVSYFVLANTTGITRTGILTIAGQTFAITQQSCSYSISPVSNTLGPQGTSGSVAVTTGPNCPWTASTDPGSWDWIGISSGTSGTGNGTVNYFALANTTISSRTGMLRVAGQTFTLTQAKSVTNNVLPITVNGSLCAVNSYFNKPCVRVTVCTPGTSTCQTINDILLDTGSFGLRIFRQALSVPLSPVPSGSGLLAECVQFGGGTSDWGPVEIATVILGDEPAVQVPIQVIDSTFGTLPSPCRFADQTPAAAGFNGILGVGLFVQDCGSGCASSSNNGIYYSCSGSRCTGTAVALSSQVQNPAALLPQDNNGLIVQLPSVPSGGLPSVNGTVVLGIGTQINNMPSGVTVYPADQVGEIMTSFNGTTYSSFIDSGSNGLYFIPPSASGIPHCSRPNSTWFCPSSTMNLSATNAGFLASPSGAVSFEISNFINLMSSSNNVFSDIGGNGGAGQFDWGLPFFFGRNVYYGFEGSASSLGTGPYYAY